jgi:hypothetical protein
MSDVDELLIASLKKLPPKPPDSASREAKKAYSESLSAVAVALADVLRRRNLSGTLPAALPAEEVVAEGKSAPKAHARKRGAERRMAGGLGAKKVDVTWATEEGGLLLALSIKSVTSAIPELAISRRT